MGIITWQHNPWITTEVGLVGLYSFGCSSLRRCYKQCRWSLQVCSLSVASLPLSDDLFSQGPLLLLTLTVKLQGEKKPKQNKQKNLFCLQVHIGTGNYPMIAFDLHNCTTGMGCAALYLRNIDFVFYALSTNRINWFACFSGPLLENKGHVVFSLTAPFFFFMHQSDLSIKRNMHNSNRVSEWEDFTIRAGRGSETVKLLWHVYI